MTTSPTMTERFPLIELESGKKTRAVTFSANGEYLVSGDEKRVRVWRVEDGKQMATMAAGLVNCLAVSQDGRWIAAGTFSGEVIVWDALKAYRKDFTLDDHYVIGLDFSPDSTQLVTAAFNCTATVWDIANREQVLTLRHDEEIIATKYSPRGDRIAVATGKFIRVYDSDNGRVFADIKAEATPWYNTGLLWSNDQLFIVSENKIKKIDASTGSAVSEWPVPDSDASSCIALEQHGKFIAYSTNRTVTVWDASDTHRQLDVIQHTQTIRSIAISPDNRFLAIAGERGKIILRRLPRNMTASIDATPLSRLHATFQEPDIQIHDAALESWKQGQLANAEALLTVAIPTSLISSHHVYASRALVRAGLQHWDAAIADAKESIKIQPSAIGYIAKSVALVGKGERHKGYRACDIAFERFHSNHVSFLLLMKAIVVFMAGEHEDAISRLDDLIATVRFNSICYVVQAQMYFLLGKSHMERGNHEGAIHSFERARAKMRRHTSGPLSAVSLISGWKFDDLDITIRQRLCEALYAKGRTKDAGESLLKLVNTIDEEVYMSKPITEWISDFTQRYLSNPESDDDTASNTTRHGNAPMLHATLNSPTPGPLLREWAKAELTRNSWKDALVASASFSVPRFTIYWAVCEHLEAVDRIADATECFHQMGSKPAVEADMHDDQAKWAVDFKLRCAEKLEHLGDTAMNTRYYDEAISRYSAALSLDLAVPQGLFIKRSKAYVAGGSWEDALNDANEVIMLDPSSPWGYERKHAALHGAGSYDNAIGTFETMLSIISQSPDSEIRECYDRYVNPAQTKTAIRRAVQNAIRGSPHVLINTNSGRLLDRSERASSFESLPVFKELTSSMTTHIDHARIKQEVTEYYRYATFSHKWEENDEPLFKKVIHIVVYDLEGSTTHDKLQMFCKIVRAAGFHWAWSDTCCINKADPVVLQEALVAMFKWYEGSAMTIIFLRGVHSPSRRGDLVKSIWNTRAWTFQEYHASKVVRFYNEDWTPYLNLDIPNHKESPEIISEMEEATRVSARTLMSLRPGLNDIREKLCLASERETTLVEDAAYSLLGIFSIYLPIVYGEGDQALGRLLRQLLGSSGDTSILAWTGKSGSFNSSLPANITVFEQFPPSHVPPPIEGAEMETITVRIRSSSLNSTLVMKLYDRLHRLPVPSFSEKRMRLPCLIFKLGPVSATWSASGRVFRARTDALGIVEIKTTEDLSQLDSLTLVHPWIDFLLDRRHVGCITEIIPEEKTHHGSSSVGHSSSSSGASTTAPVVQRRRTSRDFIGRLRRSFSAQPQDASLLPSPSPVSLMDKRTHALRLIARLRQPFGALLFTRIRHNMEEYRRVAAETMITVQVREDAPLEMLIDSVRILDVL